MGGSVDFCFGLLGGRGRIGDAFVGLRQLVRGVEVPFACFVFLCTNNTCLLHLDFHRRRGDPLLHEAGRAFLVVPCGGLFFSPFLFGEMPWCWSPGVLDESRCITEALYVPGADF
jgi:hypothetical protein